MISWILNNFRPEANIVELVEGMSWSNSRNTVIIAFMTWSDEHLELIF